MRWGGVYWFTGESDKAQASLQSAVNTLESQPASFGTTALMVRTCRYLGSLLAHGAPKEAIAWVQRGLDAPGIEQLSNDQADLKVLLGNLLGYIGEFEEARMLLEGVWEDIKPTATNTRMNALMNLGTIHSHLGNMEQCERFSRQALALCQEIANYPSMAILWDQIGYAQYQTGNWSQSMESRKEALCIIEKFGNIRRQVQLKLNLGSMYKDSGDDEMAFQELNDALYIAQPDNTLRRHMLFITMSLADLHLRRREIEQAIPLLTQAEDWAVDMNIRMMLPYIHAFWSLVHLQEGEIPYALVRAEEALSIADELSAPPLKGTAQRVYGQVQIALGEIEKATDAFGESLVHFASDPYEAARTKVAWATVLLQHTDDARALNLLEEARVTMSHLGAKRELQEIQNLHIIRNPR